MHTYACKRVEKERDYSTDSQDVLVLERRIAGSSVRQHSFRFRVELGVVSVPEDAHGGERKIYLSDYCSVASVNTDNRSDGRGLESLLTDRVKESVVVVPSTDTLLESLKENE